MTKDDIDIRMFEEDITIGNRLRSLELMIFRGYYSLIKLQHLYGHPTHILPKNTY